MAGLCVPLPTLRRAPRDKAARLGASVVRYAFTAEDFHHILLAGLPAHSLEGRTTQQLQGRAASFEALASLGHLRMTAWGAPNPSAPSFSLPIRQERKRRSNPSRIPPSGLLTWGCAELRSHTLGHLFVRARSTSLSRAWSFEDGARRSGQGRPAGPPRSGLALTRSSTPSGSSGRDEERFMMPGGPFAVFLRSRSSRFRDQV